MDMVPVEVAGQVEQSHAVEADDEHNIEDSQ